ncbi:MAG: hypothetical protein Q9167_005106 [Letrouitia subvulpina]
MAKAGLLLTARKIKQTIANICRSSSTPTGNGGNANPVASETSKRKSNRSKKQSQDSGNSPATTISGRHPKKGSARKSDDVPMRDRDQSAKEDLKAPVQTPPGEEQSEDDDGEAPRRGYHGDEEDADDPFRSSLLGHGGHPGGISTTLRALSGMVTGVTSKLKDILNNLKQKEDPSIQLIALQELSEILLVSTEDNLAGHFSPDQFVKELVTLMDPSESGEENSEMMLLACRCIANLMEALPPSTANVVYGGAVPVLCRKLLEIHYIDVAEQALSTLEKISVEFPSSIVREGGLTACLTYLDFFATSTQRTAVTTAANCCRNIPQDSFAVVKEVMPILLNVLGSSDQKVVEQGSLCVSRVVESFKYQQDKLEELISTDLLKAIRRLLVPGTTNLIGPNIHTQFLRVLSITARASPKLSAELLKMNIVDTLFQILTGVSPPSGTEDVATKIDSVVIMQALIHRPREHVYETLNVICELLPGVDTKTLSFQEDALSFEPAGDDLVLGNQPGSRKSPNAKRVELLKNCKDELRRFAVVLLPTLTDAYSSTVNLSVRQKVLTAQLKMLSNLDTTILEDALLTVPYASYLASILSQQDHPTLVTFALQAVELLLVRLEPIYRYQFYREGVMAEIAKLADQISQDIGEKVKPSKPLQSEVSKNTFGSTSTEDMSSMNMKRLHLDPSDDESNDENDVDDDEDDDDDDEPQDANGDISPSPTDSSVSDPSFLPTSQSSTINGINALRAKRLLDVHETAKGFEMRDKASTILSELKDLAKNIEACYLHGKSESGVKFFSRLSQYFDGDALDSITSAELLHSGIVLVLLNIFNSPDETSKTKARTAFLEVFMNTRIRSDSKAGNTNLPTTAFSVLVHKLQDLLSRAEHFEVLTVHQNALDNNRGSAATMLSKQLRLRLIADNDSDIPRPYKNMMISIHAIATFKALDDYLRPRISLSERPRNARQREGVSSALAAFAAAAGIPSSHYRLSERTEPTPDNGPSSIPSNVALATRPSRKGPKPKHSPLSSGSPPAKEKTPTTRRSSRRHLLAPETPLEKPSRASEEAQTPLECADERQLSDENDLDDDNALDAIVDDLEDEMDGEQLPEPTAVNMEVASTGKVTARKEDGTQIATPSQSSSVSSVLPPSSLSRELLAAGINPSAARGAMSYAAAIQAVPQDWHIEFSIDDKPIPNETTIYRAVHYNRSQPADPVARNVWAGIHPVKFKRVSGPPAPEPSSLTPSLEVNAEGVSSGMPVSLHEHPTTSNILCLLNILHELNAHLDDVLDESNESINLNPEPLAQFVNTKLTAKLNRQLEEPLIVASNCLPSWSEDLARLYPFLFPFETRHLFLQSTSFGYSRSMTRWQNAQPADDARRDRHRDDRPFVGRLQRQKVRISRSRILESALKVMELYGASPSVLEVEYFDEVGTGLGPTLEFYSTVSREFSKKKTKLWRENEASEKDEFAFSKLGMFPAPMSQDQAETESGKKILHLFKMLGKFIARSMLDSRTIDVSLNPTFFRIGDQPSTVPLSLGAVKTVDGQLAMSLKLVKQYANEKKRVDADKHLSEAAKANAIQNIQVRGAKIDNLGLDFTLPGYPSIELIPNGGEVPVTIENVASYVGKVIDMTLGSGVQRQVDAFRQGFSQVFPYSALKAFTPSELVMLFGRVEEDWSIESELHSCETWQSIED